MKDRTNICPKVTTEDNKITVYFAGGSDTVKISIPNDPQKIFDLTQGWIQGTAASVSDKDRKKLENRFNTFSFDIRIKCMRRSLDNRPKGDKEKTKPYIFSDKFYYDIKTKVSENNNIDFGTLTKEIMQYERKWITENQLMDLKGILSADEKKEIDDIINNKDISYEPFMTKEYDDALPRYDYDGVKNSELIGKKVYRTKDIRIKLAKILDRSRRNTNEKDERV